MRINWIEMENLETGLRIEKIVFNRDITLLVGLSGVGKTQILKAVEFSLKLAINKNLALQPLKVSLEFEIDEIVYFWIYKIEKIRNEELLLENGSEYEFTYEKLLCDQLLIFERNKNELKFDGYEKLPVPKADESLLLQYAADPKIKSMVTEIRKLYAIDIELYVRGYIEKETFIKLKTRIDDMMKGKKKPPFSSFDYLPVPLKIYIVKRYYEDLYMEIYDAVKELFIEIEDIDVIEDLRRERYWVAIKVYGNQLLQYDISNGMLKTIYYIVELITMSRDSLVLIDEFENGLGVNCIDVLAEMMFTRRNDLQFIITSHHPKLINQISEKKWKIIDRLGSLVVNSDSEKYGIGNSQHDSYFNLINRWEYEGKI